MEYIKNSKFYRFLNKEDLLPKNRLSKIILIIITLLLQLLIIAFIVYLGFFTDKAKIRSVVKSSLPSNFEITEIYIKRRLHV